MKFFFDYLIKQKIVTARDVIDAFVTQLQTAPSFLEILASSQKLSDEVLIDIISQQIERKTDIVSLIREMEVLSDQVIDQLLGEQTKRTKSIATILIEQNKIKQSDYLKQLHLFVSSRENLGRVVGSLALNDDHDLKDEVIAEKAETSVNSAALESLKELVGSGGVDESVLQELGNTVAENKVDEGVEIVATSQEEPAVNSAALESLKELVGSGGLDESVLQELDTSTGNSSLGKKLNDFSGKIDSDELFLEMLFEKYSEKVHLKMVKIMELIGNTIEDGDYPKQLVLKFQKEVKEISGLFGIIEATPMTYLTDLMDQFLTKLNIKYEDREMVDNSFPWKETFSDIADFFWNARQAIHQSGNLETFIADKENQLLFIKIVNKLGQL